MEDPGSNHLSGSRRVIATCGYAMLCLSVVLHIAMWVRTEHFCGFWGHFSEASRWFRVPEPADEEPRGAGDRGALGSSGPTRNQHALILHRHGRIVMMDACKLSSRLRVASTACAVLPTPGTVG
jgi:hypothetical protein